MLVSAIVVDGIEQYPVVYSIGEKKNYYGKIRALFFLENYLTVVFEDDSYLEYRNCKCRLFYRDKHCGCCSKRNECEQKHIRDFFCDDYEAVF